MAAKGKNEQLLVADQLDQMGVDVIEAGFAMASAGDFNSVKAIAERINNATVCSLARAKKSDIERAAEALEKARDPRIHTFMSTSDIHLEYQYKINQERCLEMIEESVSFAKSFFNNIEWSAMHYPRVHLYH